MTKEPLHFEEVINRLKGLLGVNADKELAKELSMSPNAFHNRKKSASLPYPQIISIANEQKVNLNWLINGTGPIYKDTISDEQQNYSDEIPSSEKSTQPDPDSSKTSAIAEDLIEIEKLSDELIDSIASHIKSSLNAARIIKQTSKKPPKEDDNDFQERKSS